MNQSTALNSFATAALSLALTAPAAYADSQPVRVINTNANPVPVNGNVVISGTANVNVANPVTIANPVNTVTIGNANPIPVSISAMPALQPGTIPARPFYGRIDSTGAPDGDVIGAVAARIGVTSILITNSLATPQTIIFANVLAADPAGCTPWGSSTITGGGSPFMYLTVEASKTTQFTFPTPLVFDALNAGGVTCIGLMAPAGIRLFVSGVLP